MIFYDILKLHEIQISMSISKVLLEHSHENLFKFRLWLLSCYSQKPELSYPNPPV